MEMGGSPVYGNTKNTDAMRGLTATVRVPECCPRGRGAPRVGVTALAHAIAPEDDSTARRIREWSAQLRNRQELVQGLRELCEHAVRFAAWLSAIARNGWA
jgi:hypothetical protein